MRARRFKVRVSSLRRTGTQPTFQQLRFREQRRRIRAGAMLQPRDPIRVIEVGHDVAIAATVAVYHHVPA
jgi:hypothetical protein